MRPRLRARGTGRANRELFGKPDGVELLIQIVTRRDLPALHFGTVWNDPMPLERHQVVRFVIQQALFELADVLLALLHVGSTTLLFVEVIQRAVDVTAIVGWVLVHGLK